MSTSSSTSSSSEDFDDEAMFQQAISVHMQPPSQVGALPFHLRTITPAFPDTMTAFTLNPASMCQLVGGLYNSREITVEAFLDSRLWFAGARAAGGNTSTSRGQTISASRGAAASLGWAPAIQWRMLRRDDRSLTLRIDKAFPFSDGPSNAWHAGQTHEITAESLRRTRRTQQHVIHTVMADIARETLQANTHDRERHTQLRAEGIPFLDIHPAELYHLLSARSVQYLEACVANPDMWMPNADLMLLFAESETEADVRAGLSRNPGLMGRITRIEVNPA